MASAGSNSTLWSHSMVKGVSEVPNGHQIAVKGMMISVAVEVPQLRTAFISGKWEARKVVETIWVLSNVQDQTSGQLQKREKIM